MWLNFYRQQPKRKTLFIGSTNNRPKINNSNNKISSQCYCFDYYDYLNTHSHHHNNHRNHHTHTRLRGIRWKIKFWWVSVNLKFVYSVSWIFNVVPTTCSQSFRFVFMLYDAADGFDANFVIADCLFILRI